MTLDEINKKTDEINKKVDEKLDELKRLQEKSSKFDIGKMNKNPTEEDLKIAVEVKKKFGQYMKTNDFDGAQRYLNHMKNELCPTNR